MSGWVILVRIIDKTYKEFVSKKGNYTKVLTLEMIDRTGKIIEGTFFGETATVKNKSIVKEGIYKVSGGTIREN